MISALLLGGAHAAAAVESDAPSDAAVGAAAAVAVSDFEGVAWADSRDDYAGDTVAPSGLSTPDTCATAYAKSEAIVGGFATLEANTVRLPVNPRP